MTNIELKKELINELTINSNTWFSVGILTIKIFAKEPNYKANRNIYRKRIYRCLNYFKRINIVEVRNLNIEEYKWRIS